MRLIAALFALGTLGLAACSTTGTLEYAPSAAVQPGPSAAVGSVSAVDQRDEKPNRVATIRGGYGNPLKVLDIARPVSEEVAAAVGAGLRARGMMGSPGVSPYRVQVVLRTLYGDQYIGRKAVIDMELRVADRSGAIIYTDSVKDQTYEGTIFDNGIFAGIGELGRSVQTLMNRSVDRLLDKEGLRAVLSGAPAARPAA